MKEIFKAHMPMLIKAFYITEKLI